MGLLRQADVDLGKGMNVPDICRRLGISHQTYHHKRPHGGLKWMTPAAFNAGLNDTASGAFSAMPRGVSLVGETPEPGRVFYTPSRLRYSFASVCEKQQNVTCCGNWCVASHSTTVETAMEQASSGGKKNTPVEMHGNAMVLSPASIASRNASR